MVWVAVPPRGRRVIIDNRPSLDTRSNLTDHGQWHGCLGEDTGPPVVCLLTTMDSRIFPSQRKQYANQRFLLVILLEYTIELADSRECGAHELGLIPSDMNYRSIDILFCSYIDTPCVWTE